MKNIIFSVFAIILIPSIVFGANIYVRDGGSANGSDGRNGDWNTANCYDQVTSAEAVAQRGDVIYVADGSYNSVTFNVSTSGTTLITVKKATDSGDHGTETGWVSTYGDGQATINRPLTISSGYWVIDGQERNEDNWFDGTVYGIRVYHNGSNTSALVDLLASNVTMQYVYVEAYPTAAVSAGRGYGIDLDENCSPVYSNLTFTKIYISGGTNSWFLRGSNTVVIEYSATSGVKSNGANHGENINMYYCSQNVIVRYSKFYDSFVGSAGTAIVAETDGGDGLEFYGNVVWDFETGDGAIGFGAYGSSNNKIYNNTFINSTWGSSGINFGTGTNNVAYNNIWTDCVNVYLTGIQSSANNDTSFSSGGYTDYDNDDFTLSGATAAGTSLSSPYNTDLLGNIRGSDGTWDRGAYEYSPGGDVTAPVVTISNNDPDGIGSDSLYISGTATDAVGVTGCKYRIGSGPDESNGTALTGTTT